MRSTIWSRAARPKLNGSCTTTSTPKPWKASVSRQTASGPVRRQLTVNDVFTLLLTPILATALLADTSWKDKRRKDWAHKIAEIEAETEQIQSRAAHSWQTIQSRSLSLGAAQQRRQYSAVAMRTQVDDEGAPRLEGSDFRSLQTAFEEAEYEPVWFEVTPKQARDSSLGPGGDHEHDSARSTQGSLERSERLRRLLAIKLALNLTIYVNTGVSPSKLRREIRIPGIDADFKYDPHETQDLPKLLQRMRDVCSRMEQLQKSLPNGAIPVRKDTINADSQHLQDEICTLSERFERSSITMPEFVTSYTIAVLRSRVPPTSKAYLALFRGFARGSSVDRSSHDLAMQTLFAWEQSRLPIGDHDLFVILTELARRKHVQKFDGLMRDLTMSPSPLNTIGKWTWERANDIQVPVPRSYNPAILVTLIHCALRFDQPQKAEAWSQILRRTWMDVNDPTQKTPLQQVFTNWMRYYEVHGNWRKGVTWLDAAQKWAITVASFDMYSLQKLAVGMLSLCFACGKSREYEQILNAAVDSGIPSINPRHFLEGSARRSICREWDHLHYEAYRNKRDLRSDQEKAQAFQGKVKAVTQRLLPDKDSADVEWRQQQEDKPNPLVTGQTSDQAAARWQQLYLKNQEALKNALATAQKWRSRCALQQKEMNNLESRLAHKQKLVQDPAGSRTTVPSKEGKTANLSDDIPVVVPGRSEQIDAIQQESDLAHALSLSHPNDAGPAGQKTYFQRSDHDFLRSHLVETIDVKTSDRNSVTKSTLNVQRSSQLKANDSSTEEVETILSARPTPSLEPISITPAGPLRPQNSQSTGMGNHSKRWRMRLSGNMATDVFSSRPSHGDFTRPSIMFTPERA